MFKLFKDLTRPPERLDQPSSASPTPPISAPSSLGYAARQRNRPSIPPTEVSAPSDASRDVGPKAAPMVQEVEEVDEDAKKVMEYLENLDKSEGVMSVVEVSRRDGAVVQPMLTRSSFCRNCSRSNPNWKPYGRSGDTEASLLSSTRWARNWSGKAMSRVLMRRDKSRRSSGWRGSGLLSRSWLGLSRIGAVPSSSRSALPINALAKTIADSDRKKAAT